MYLSCATRLRMRDYCWAMRWGPLLLSSAFISLFRNAEAGVSGGVQGPPPFDEGSLYGGSIEVVPVPLDVLRSSEFSTLLATYNEDVEFERKQTECRFWIDVDYVKTQGSNASNSFSQFGGDCSSLNKKFGAQLVDSVSGKDKSSASVKCTAAPWFAEAEIKKVTRKRGPGGSPYFLADLKYTYPSSLAAGATSQVTSLPSTVPLTPGNEAQRSGYFKPPAAGDKATLVCLAKGSHMMLIRDTEDATQTDLEFMPGPWSVEVEVEMYPDPLRVMGVRVQLRLMENLSVTLPPTRVLPVTTVGLTGEQWLLLELAELRSRKRRQREEAQEEASADLGWGEEVLSFSSRTEMQSSQFPIGPCQLRRRKGFNEPVLLDCLPPIKPRKRGELMMNVFDIARRGAWGIACALLAAMSINGPFHSLIQTIHVNDEALDSASHDLSLFSVAREWKVEPRKSSESQEGGSSSKSQEDDALNKQALIEAISWTPKQNKELNVIASEMLEVYARGGKDRRKHTKEKNVTFIETDSKLEIRVAISSLSRPRRRLLGLNKYPDAELVFTFTDLEGSFRPFHKIPKAEASKVSVSEQVKHNKSAGQTLAVEGHKNRAATAAAEGEAHKEDDEERMTMLQLMWQNVVTPQHDELRKIAIGNVLWDISVAAFFLVVSALSTKLMGLLSGKATAASLQDSRAARYTGYVAYDLPVIPGPQEIVKATSFTDVESLSQREAAASLPAANAATVELIHASPIVTSNVNDAQQR
ncbi:hypothetical protein Emed_005909 [Eimeria media]